jgi:phasin family protein
LICINLQVLESHLRVAARSAAVRLGADVAMSASLRENIMSKDSKPTKKATVSKRKPTKKATVSKRKSMKKGTVSKGKSTKKGTVSNDSKPAEESAVSNDSKPTETATVSNDCKPAEESAVSNDSKPTETATVSNDCKPAEESAVSNDMKPTEKGAAGETPVFDFTKLMSQFQLPGVDFTALVDRERKNIEALVKANWIAFEGWQRLVRRQAEMLQETMKKVVADAGQEVAVKKRADLAKGGLEKALANMRELAEMTSQSQKEAFDVVRKRIEENVEDIRNLGKKTTK